MKCSKSLNVTQTHESNDPQKNPFAAAAAAVVAASIVAIITLERLNAFTFAVSRCFGLWRIARAHINTTHSHPCTRTCGEWREFRSEEKREMCNVFFKLWLCGILHYTTHMCVSGLASNVKLPLTCSHSGSRSLACSLICLCLPSSSFTLSSTTTSSSYLSVLSHTHTLIRSPWEHLAHFTMGEWRRERGQSESGTTIINVRNCEQMPLERNVERMKKKCK